jgi:hypothetical protein
MNRRLSLNRRWCGKVLTLQSCLARKFNAAKKMIPAIENMNPTNYPSQLTGKAAPT